MILDSVRARCQRVAGRQVFAWNTVGVTVRGVRQTEAGVWRSPFLQGVFEREIRSGLTRAGIRFPEDLTVQVNTTPDFPSSGEQWVSVEVETRARHAAGGTRRTARLVVLEGTANIPEMAIEKARTNIGRTVDVHRTDGPSRRNDLAFCDDSPVNRTVSREHAHILFSKARGECRLFNDRIYNGANCGLWILRDGLSQAVHRDARGVRLLADDEIHFGSAVVRFVVR